MTALIGIDARLLSLETCDDLLPFRDRIEEQARADPAGGDERLPGLTIAKTRREADPSFLIDGMGELTQKWRGVPVASEGPQIVPGIPL